MKSVSEILDGVSKCSSASYNAGLAVGRNWDAEKSFGYANSVKFKLEADIVELARNGDKGKGVEVVDVGDHRIIFTFDGDMTMATVFKYIMGARKFGLMSVGVTQCNPADTYSEEIGKRIALKRACTHFPKLYRKYRNQFPLKENLLAATLYRWMTIMAELNA